MMLLLRRRKSDHSPPFFLRKLCECIIFPNCISTTEHISTGRDQAKKRDGMERGGKRGYLEEEEAFFLEGRVSTSVFAHVFGGYSRMW